MMKAGGGEGKQDGRSEEACTLNDDGEYIRNSSNLYKDRAPRSSGILYTSKLVAQDVCINFRGSNS